MILLALTLISFKFFTTDEELGDWFIYLTTLFSDSLILIVLIAKVFGKTLPPKVLIIASTISFLSDLGQYSLILYRLQP